MSWACRVVGHAQVDYPAVPEVPGVPAEAFDLDISGMHGNAKVMSPPLYIGIFTGGFFSIYIYLCLFIYLDHLN